MFYVSRGGDLAGLSAGAVLGRRRLVVEQQISIAHVLAFICDFEKVFGEN